MRDPAILFYTSDFLTGTITMTDDQVGKYIRLLCLQHQKGGMLTEKDMLNICKSHDDDIFSKFKKNGNGYYNERMKIEIERRKKYSESRSKNRCNKEKKHKNISKSYDKHMKTYVEHMEIEIENENINRDISIKKGDIKGEDWKTSFKIYQQQLSDSFNSLIKDEDYIKNRQKYHSGLNIRLSLEKAYKDYWNTEAGWKRKKQARIKEIDWKATFTNALSLKSNQVWIDYKKEQVSESHIYPRKIRETILSEPKSIKEILKTN